MGSMVFARACAERGDRTEAMICLKRLGVFSDEQRSQFLLEGILASLIPARFDHAVGNFVAVVGNVESKAVAQEFSEPFEGRR